MGVVVGGRLLHDWVKGRPHRQRCCCFYCVAVTFEGPTDCPTTTTSGRGGAAAIVGERESLLSPWVDFKWLQGIPSHPHVSIIIRGTSCAESAEAVVNEGHKSRISFLWPLRKVKGRRGGHRRRRRRKGGVVY